MQKRKKRPGSEHDTLRLIFSASRGRRGVSGPSRLRKGWWGLALVVALSAVAPGPHNLFAKKKEITRTITGVVLDKSNNAIVGAAVELTDLNSGKKIAIYSQEDGSYQFSGLPPSHDYQVQARHKGESSEVRQVSSIDPRNRMVINLTIPPANP